MVEDRLERMLQACRITIISKKKKWPEEWKRNVQEVGDSCGEEKVDNNYCDNNINKF